MSSTINATGTRLVDFIELKRLGIITSRTSLHRYLHRESSHNRFPQPMRNTVTGRRYWYESDVVRWKQHEDRRRCMMPEDPLLVPDTDPTAWMPKGTRHVLMGAPVAAPPATIPTDSGIR